MNNPSSPLIICGTDFSTPARAAADAAAAIAKRTGATLRLIHASEICESPLTKEHLAQECLRLGHCTRLNAEILEGAAHEVLLHEVQQHNAELVIVSSLGRHAPIRWLLGSVAERTAEASPVPTLVVRDAAPFEAWARGERSLRIFVGTDFSVSSDAALQWVANLRQIGPCEVIAAYADWAPQEAARLGIRGAIGMCGNPPVVQSLLERDLTEKVTRILGPENVEVVVQGGWGRPDAQLVSMAMNKAADLVVVGTHQRHGLERLGHASVFRGILHYSPMSVACIPVPAVAPMEVPRIHDCQRVLVAVDLDEKHGFASPFGYGVCAPGGTVRLVHITPSPHAPLPAINGYYQEPANEGMDRQHSSRLENRLYALAPDEAAARNIPTEVEIIEDQEIAQAICAAAERFNADVICIGSHTRPGLQAKLLGSVSLGVMQASHCPVLVVRPPVI